jgi:hypothetical protein
MNSLTGVMRMRTSFLSVDEELSPQPFTPGMEEGDMNAFRDSIADALVTMRE